MSLATTTSSLFAYSAQTRRGNKLHPARDRAGMHKRTIPNRSSLRMRYLTAAYDGEAIAATASKRSVSSELAQACAGEDFVYGGVGINAALSHLRRELVEIALGEMAARHALHQARLKQTKEPFLPVRNFARAAIVRIFEMIAERLNLLRQFVDALAVRRDCAHHGRLPAVSFGNQRQDCAKRLLESARAFAIGLVENKNVANLHQPGFETLD